MQILSTAHTPTPRCLCCGYAFRPQELTGLTVTCPVIGCYSVFDREELDQVLPPPQKQNIAAGVTTRQPDGAPCEVFYGRDGNGEIIVTGVSGNPTNLNIEECVGGRAVMGIAPGAFANKTSLRRITLPDTVSLVGENAFAGCTALEQVTFGKGLTLLDKGCFRNCTSLDSVTLPARLQEIGRDAFANCEALEQVVLLGQVQVIRDGAFAFCIRLSDLTYPEKPRRVASGAFVACYALPQSLQDQLLPSF